MADHKNDFGVRADGSPRNFGDLTSDERRTVMKNVIAKLKSEFEDPNSALRKNCEVILNGPDIPTTKQ